jgi:hypothetical protein
MIGLLPIACSVILERGCRAKNPGLFAPSRHRFRDSSRAPDTRAGMTTKTAAVQKPPHYCAGLNKHLVVSVQLGQILTELKADS